MSTEEDKNITEVMKIPDTERKKISILSKEQKSTLFIEKQSQLEAKSAELNKLRKRELLKNLRALHELIVTLNEKGFKTRYQKRQFWRDFIKSDKFREDAILRLMDELQWTEM